MRVHLAARSLQLILALSLLVGTAWCEDNPLLGEWKLNPKKSKLTDVMKVESLGGEKYSFDFGGGDPEIAVADGTDQPGHFGITIAVSVQGPDRWKVVRKKDGKVLATGVWTLSKDGTHLNDHFTAARPNGDLNTLDYLYNRTGGGSGFAGTWVSVKAEVNSVVLLKIHPWEHDGLSFISEGGGGTRNVKTDGKDYANVGAIVDGMTASARRIDQRTVELTDRTSGKVRDTQKVNVSADGRTLTVTTYISGRTEPDVQVFDKVDQ